MNSRVAIRFILAVSSVVVGEASRTNFKVRRYELCNETQGLVKHLGNITSEGNDQYITLDLTTPFPWDDKIGVVVVIEMQTVGTVFTELFVIREKNVCKACNKYWGEFWYDIQRAAQMPVGYCPVPAGRYRMHHHRLNCKKIALQTFPFGRLRFTIRLIENKHPEIHLICVVIEVDNVAN